MANDASKASKKDEVQPEAPVVDVVHTSPEEDNEEAVISQVHNRPNLQEDGEQVQAEEPEVRSSRGRSEAIEVLIDSLPDEFYEAHNLSKRKLNRRGVDEKTGFDLLAFNNAQIDAVRVRLRSEGYNI